MGQFSRIWTCKLVLYIEINISRKLTMYSDRYENCMLLFYRRRGIVEVTKVQLQNNHYARSLLPMPIPYTSIVPSANADILAGEVSFELSSPVCPPQTVTIPLYNNAPSTIVATHRCHDILLGNDFEVRMVNAQSRL